MAPRAASTTLMRSMAAAEKIVSPMMVVLSGRRPCEECFRRICGLASNWRLHANGAGNNFNVCEKTGAEGHGPS
jgi:hypothetical protein